MVLSPFRTMLNSKLAQLGKAKNTCSLKGRGSLRQPLGLNDGGSLEVGPNDHRIKGMLRSSLA